MAVGNIELAYLLDPAFQVENNNGKPVVGGHLEVYLAGTDTKYITYQNWDYTENPFKIPLTMDGRAVILVDSSQHYDLYAYDSYNNQIFSRLNITPIRGDGISQIYHDWSLKGQGTQISPLGVKRYKNLAVDNTMTAYEGTVKGKGSLILGVNRNWLSGAVGLTVGGFVTNEDFSSYSANVEDTLSLKANTNDLSGFMTTANLYETFVTKDTYSGDLTNYYLKTETSSKDEISNAFDELIREDGGVKAYVGVNNNFTSISSFVLHKQIYTPSSCLLVGTDDNGVSSWLGYTMPDSWTNVKNELGNPKEQIFLHSLYNDSSNTFRATGIELPVDEENRKPTEVYGSVRVGISNGDGFSIVPASSMYNTMISGGQEVIDEWHVNSISPSQNANFRNVVPYTEQTYNFAFTGNNLGYICIKDGSSATNVSATNWVVHCKW